MLDSIFGVLRRIAGTKIPDLIFTVGIPGSGKSYWIKSQSGHVVISPDKIRKDLTGDIADQSKNAQVWAIAKRMVSDALKEGKNVILDATNLISFYRQQFLRGLPEHKLKAKIFEVSPDIAKKRVRKDIEEGRFERADVPEDVIDEMYQQFRKTVDEGELESEGFKIL